MSHQDHPPLTQVTIASRGSALALWQAEYVRSLLAKRGVAAEILVVKTKGDRVQDRFLHEIGGKGVFVREIEEALLAGKADLAVHSLKDLSAVTPQPFTLAAILPRHHSGDVMICHPDFAEQWQLQDGFTIEPQDLARWGEVSMGTGSLRRSCLLKGASDAIVVTPIRGNVDSRINKLRAKNWQAIVLAQASLERLGLAQDLVKGLFNPSWFIPSPSQGALVVETLSSHPMVPWLQGALGCPATTQCVTIERGVLAALGGDCTLPVGVHTRLQRNGATTKLQGDAVILDGKGHAARTRMSMEWQGMEWQGAASAATACGELVRGLIAAGGQEVLQGLGLPPVSERAFL